MNSLAACGMLAALWRAVLAKHSRTHSAFGGLSLFNPATFWYSISPSFDADTLALERGGHVDMKHEGATDMKEDRKRRLEA